jgi:hypothetical protein
MSTVEKYKPCECCRERIKGKRYYSEGVGVVCMDCGVGLRIAVRALNSAGVSGIFIGRCGDNDTGREAA